MAAPVEPTRLSDAESFGHLPGVLQRNDAVLETVDHQDALAQPRQRRAVRVRAHREIVGDRAEQREVGVARASRPPPAATASGRSRTGVGRIRGRRPPKEPGARRARADPGHSARRRPRPWNDRPSGRGRRREHPAAGRAPGPGTRACRRAEACPSARRPADRMRSPCRGAPARGYCGATIRRTRPGRGSARSPAPAPPPDSGEGGRPARRLSAGSRARQESSRRVRDSRSGNRLKMPPVWMKQTRWPSALGSRWSVSRRPPKALAV